MRCKNYEEAVSQATANADLRHEFWCVFSDTSGNWCCETYRGQTLRSSSGVCYERIKPKELWTRFIPIVNNEIECWDIVDLLDMTTNGDDADPTCVMSIHNGRFVQPVLNWLNSSYSTFHLGKPIS